MTTSDDHVTGHEDIAELRERLRNLEARVTRMERGMGSAVPSATLSPGPASVALPTTGFTVATVFTRVAMLSFVLMGALILRVLTERHILGAWFGTLLGFAYAGHLIVLSFLPGRLGNLARTTSLFQCCGVLLGFCIALESSLRTHTFDRLTAMAFMAGLAALALMVAAVHRKLSLAWIALSGTAVALVALGLEAHGMPLQLTLLTTLGALAAGFSWRRDWGLLRLLVFPLLMILLAAGFLLARQQSLDNGLLLTSVIAFWAVVLVQHLVAFRRLDWPAAVWLPAATAWLGGIAWLEHCAWLANAASGVSGLTILMLGMTTGRVPSAAGTAGLALMATVAGSIGWPMLDASGVLCALAGVGLWMAIRKGDPSWASGCAVFLMGVAAVRGLLHVAEPVASTSSLFAGSLLATVLLFHYLHTEGPVGEGSSGLSRYLAPAVLVAGLLVLLGILRMAGHRFFSNPAFFQLSQTGILVLAATVLTFWGHAGRRPSVKYIGLSCMVVSLLKVGLGDLVQLSGIPLISSVVLVGLSSVVVSVILHRRV